MDKSALGDIVTKSTNFLKAVLAVCYQFIKFIIVQCYTFIKPVWDHIADFLEDNPLKSSLTIIAGLLAAILGAHIFGDAEIVFLLVIFLFIALDYWTFALRAQALSEEEQDKIVYIPNLRVWGLGVVVGICILLRKYIIVIQQVFAQQPHPEGEELIQQLGVMGFMLLLFACLLMAIVRLVRDDD